MTRYTVNMFRRDGRDFHEGAADDAIDAVRRCVKTNHMQLQPGEYQATVANRYGKSSGVVTVNADGSVSIGARWNLPTPAEPIPDSGALPAGCPDASDQWAANVQPVMEAARSKPTP